MTLQFKVGTHFPKLASVVKDGKNEKKKIVEIKERFLPFTLWRSKTKGKYCIELATPGAYKVGDQLKF